MLKYTIRDKINKHKEEGCQECKKSICGECYYHYLEKSYYIKIANISLGRDLRKTEKNRKWVDDNL